MMGRLQGKVAVVTGAGSGIGKRSVELFRSEGATVVAADIQGAEVTCDAGSESDVEALVAKAVADHGTRLADLGAVGAAWAADPDSRRGVHAQYLQ